MTFQPRLLPFIVPALIPLSAPYPLTPSLSIYPFLLIFRLLIHSRCPLLVLYIHSPAVDLFMSTHST